MLSLAKSHGGEPVNSSPNSFKVLNLLIEAVKKKAQTGISTMTCILHKMLKPSVDNYKNFFQEDNRSAWEWKRVKGWKIDLHQITMGKCKIQERQHQNEDFKTCSEEVHLTVVSNCIHFLLRINSNFCHFLLKETVLQHRAEAEGRQRHTYTK